MKPQMLPVVVIGIFFACILGLRMLAGALRVGRGRAGKLPPIFGYLTLGLLLAALGLLYLDDGMRADPYDEIIRGQFRLPGDVSLGRVSRPVKQSICWLDSVHYSARVQLTPQQYAQYAASLRDPAAWQTINRKHFGEHVRFALAEGALAWRDLPEPPSLGSQQAVWRIAGEDVRHGKAQCVDLTPSANGAVYSVFPCDARDSTADTPPGGAHMEAALDSDRQSLNVSLHFRSKAAYCDNKVTKALNRALGLSEPDAVSAARVQ